MSPQDTSPASQQPEAPASEAAAPKNGEAPKVEGIRRVRTKKNIGRPRSADLKKYNASTHYVIAKKHIDDFIYAGLLGRLDGYQRIALISKVQAWFNLPDFYMAQARAQQMKIAAIERKERRDEKPS
jgi:hypothetical protein